MNNAVADVHRIDVTAVNPELGAVRHTSPSSPGGSNDDPKRWPLVCSIG
jgi:hypothetical protein